MTPMIRPHSHEDYLRMLARDAVTEFERLRAAGASEVAAHRQAAGTLSVTNDAVARYARCRSEGWSVDAAREEAVGGAAYALVSDLREHGVEVGHQPEWDRPAPVTRPDFERDAPMNEIVREALDYVEDLVAAGVERDEAYHALRSTPVAQSVVTEYDGALTAGLTFDAAREHVLDSLHVPAHFDVHDVTSAPPPPSERALQVLVDLELDQHLPSLAATEAEFDQIIRDDRDRGETLAAPGPQEQTMNQDNQMGLAEAIRRVVENTREEAPEREWSDVDAIASTVGELTMDDIDAVFDDDEELHAAFSRVLRADRGELAAQLDIEPDTLPAPLSELTDDSAAGGAAVLGEQITECGQAVDAAEDAAQNVAGTDVDSDAAQSERCARWNAEDEAAELAADDSDGWGRA